MTNGGAGSAAPRRPKRFRRVTVGAIVVALAAGLVIAGTVSLTRSRPHRTTPVSKTAGSSREPSKRAVGTTFAPIGPTGSSTSSPTIHPPAKKSEVFDAKNALRDIRALAGFGVRQEGSIAEKTGARYVAAQLTSLGYSPRLETFALPNGKTSQNVIAVAKGSSDRTIVLGAHVDSKPPSPGANDNASGCAALLEIARILSVNPATATVTFVWFGSEEMMDSNSSHHHFGSRFHVAHMSHAEKQATVGMISVDMIGYGSEFVSRTMGRGPQSMSDLLISRGKSLGLPAHYLVDQGSTGQSDHEAFEFAGIPVSWVEWRTDPVYHTAGDTSTHVNSTLVRRAGQFILDFVSGLSATDLERLAASR